MIMLVDHAVVSIDGGSRDNDTDTKRLFTCMNGVCEPEAIVVCMRRFNLSAHSITTVRSCIRQQNSHII